MKLKTLIENIERVGFDPKEESPDFPVDWKNPDIQMNHVWDIPTVKKFAGVPKNYEAIYPSIIDVNELYPKLAEDDDDIPEEDRGGYDWEEFRFRRRGFPPIVVRRTNGKMHILDGNHRTYWAQQNNYQTIAAWVVDDDIQKHIEGKRL